MLHQKTEQAGTELCQAQSKLIQIGRVVRKKIEVGKKVKTRLISIVSKPN